CSAAANSPNPCAARYKKSKMQSFESSTRNQPRGKLQQVRKPRDKRATAKGQPRQCSGEYGSKNATRQNPLGTKFSLSWAQRTGAERPDNFQRRRKSRAYNCWRGNSSSQNPRMCSPDRGSAA